MRLFIDNWKGFKKINDAYEYLREMHFPDKDIHNLTDKNAGYIKILCVKNREKGYKEIK